jgi:hypothetical protein
MRLANRVGRPMDSSFVPSRVWSRRPKYARVDFETVRAATQRNALAICRRVLPGGKLFGAEYVVCNPKRDDRYPGSFKINLRTGRWADFATGERGGDLTALIAWRYGISQIEAARRLATLLAVEPDGVR